MVCEAFEMTASAIIDVPQVNDELTVVPQENTADCPEETQLEETQFEEMQLVETQLNE